MKKLYICLFLILMAFVAQQLVQSTSNKVSEPPKIIVSLTSYPARIKTVHQTIETILHQTKKADKVVLWLAPEQFPGKEVDLPRELLDLTHKGLTIDWYHDIRSYKKLIPALKKYPNDVIITADDDILYPEYWLSNLYEQYKTDPHTIWCHRAHRVVLDDNEIAPYNKWKKCINKGNPSYLHFCTGAGGILYPPHSFHPDIFNEEKFTSLSPDTDDIWFWAMSLMNNKKKNVVTNNMKFLFMIRGTQKTALWRKNVDGGNNDVSLKKVLKEYPEILNVLKKEKQPE